MAKKQLKKLNQPKKYLQGGSNMASVAQTRQNPYYIGQVNADAAEEKFQSSQDQIAKTQQNAIANKQAAEDASKEQVNATVRDNATSLIQSGIKDQKAGKLGLKKMFYKNPIQGQAALNLSAGTQVAPMYAAPATTTVSSNVGSLIPGATEVVGTNLANTSTNVVSGVNAATAGVPSAVAPTGEIVTQGVSAGAKGTAGMSSLAASGIGLAATVGGEIWKHKSNDNSDYTFTDKERRGNMGGSALSSAGTGFGIGATVGSFVPVVGNVVGGLIGAGIGAGVGALKARKENKAAEEEAARLQREQAAVRGAYQSAFVNSRLTSADTGFGLNSSTNMNNNFTNQYQVARDGGVTGIQEDRRPKKVPGGKIVPIEGTDAVEFKGRSHEKGGIHVDSKTEVEGGETQDQVVMNNNNKQDYIFSKYLKLGGKSFAQRHKEILKGNGSQAEIQQLAAMQEKVAGRDSKQVAAYGGFHKYLEGGVKPCPECPPGTICDVATGACVPDEDNSSNSYDWQATGLEGFKANQAATTTPAKPAGKQVSQADYDFYIREKNARLADEQNKIAAQNGTANAPADATPKVTYPPFGDPVENFRKNRDAQNAENSAKYGTYVDKSLVTANSTKTGKEALEAGMARSAEDDRLRAEKEAQLNATNTTAPVTPGVQPPANTQPAAQTDNTVAPDGTKLPAGYVWDATLNAPVSNAAMAASSNTKGNNAPNATPDWDTKKKAIIDQVNSTPDMLVEPDKKAQIIEMLNSPDPKMRDQGMYIFDLYSQVQTGQTIDPKVTPATGYNPTPGVTPPVAPTTPPVTTQTNTGTPTPPAAATTNDGFAAPAKRATSTGAATGTPQTPEEKEAARLAGLPRLFMGANRKVDETTGEVTAYTDKPLMGVGAMAGSRLGTATGSQEDLAKVTRNSYDQAWTNKADNLYTNQKDASGGGLSSSDAIADRDKIAESNWGKKYGYSKGMSAEDAKKAHGKFAEDVHSLFKNNPDEMMGYFQYIIDGGVNNPKAPGTYLGKDAEQIRNNLTKKGFIGADGRPIAGKEKEMAAYLENQATNNAVGPIHNALGSFTAERGSTRIKLEEQKKKEVEKPVQELPKKFEPCPPGTYRSGDGTCKQVGDVPQAARISGTLMAGLGQLIPVGAALANPYKIAPGIMGAAAVKGALMPRVNLNQERASAIQQNVAYKNAVVAQNAGPGALAAMQMANTKTNEQMLKIAQQEQDSNRQLASEEGKMGMQASMFNAENEQKRQMFNTEFNQKERQYRREDILGALDTGAARIAGIVKDDRAYKAQERLATALDETGSYDRFSILEQLNREARRKNSPYYGTTETERRRMAAAMHKELNPEGYIGMSEYTKLQEEKAKLQKEKEEAEKKNQAKFGGARQYVSRLGELKGVRGTKAKL
jgi:hypothetical protein